MDAEQQLIDPINLRDDLALRLSDDGHQLLAEFAPSAERQPIELTWFRAKLMEHGLDQLRMDLNALGLCVRQYNEGTHQSSINIAERIDAEFSVKVDKDQMHVSLTVIPAQGGVPVSVEQIARSLEKQGITHGIDSQAIADAVNQPKGVENQIIARGTPAEDGKDGWFESLIPDIKDRRPRIDDDGVAHYKDISQLITVRPGDELLLRHLPTEGTPGQTVTGAVISATRGTDMMFASSLAGTQIDPQNSNLLRAAIVGQPVFIESGAIVEPTVTVDNVDMKSGNIDFDGTVIVKGNVTTGMLIKVLGDVHVHGMVEAATVIEASGDITVKNGVIGRGSITEDNGQPGKGIVRLHAAGNLQARFIENCICQAGNNIQVEELIAHSDVIAGQQILVGGNRAKRGNIMGGICRAETLVEAQVIGSPSGACTQIEVGVSPQKLEQLQQLNAELEEKNKQREALEIAWVRLSQLQHSAKPMSAAQKTQVMRIRATLNSLTEDLKALEQNKASLQSALGLLASARIIAHRKFHQGIEMAVFTAQSKCTEERGPGVFQLQDRTISYTPQ